MIITGEDIEIRVGGKSFPVRSVEYSDRMELAPLNRTPGAYVTEPVRLFVRAANPWRPCEALASRDPGRAS